MIKRPVVFKRLALVASALVVGGAAIALVELFAGSDLRVSLDRETTTSQASNAIASSTPPAAFSIHDQPQELPDIQFVDGNGRPGSLSDFRGKTVLLNIWATWCGPCRREMPTLDRLQAALSGPDFEVVALSIDRGGLEVISKFYREIGVEHLAMYVDTSSKATRELGVVGLPTTLLLDSAGREIGRLVGPAEWDSPDMVGFIRNHMPAQAGAATNTRKETK